MAMKNNNCYLFVLFVLHIDSKWKKQKRLPGDANHAHLRSTSPHREDDLGGRRSSTFTHEPAQKHRGRSQGDLPRPLDRVVSVEGSREDPVQTAVVVECFVFVFLLKRQSHLKNNSRRSRRIRGKSQAGDRRQTRDSVTATAASTSCLRPFTQH